MFTIYINIYLLIYSTSNATPSSRLPFSLFERPLRPPGHESVLILDLEHRLAKVLALQHADEALGGIIDALGDA